MLVFTKAYNLRNPVRVCTDAHFQYKDVFYAPFSWLARKLNPCAKGELISICNLTEMMQNLCDMFQMYNSSPAQRFK